MLASPSIRPTNASLQTRDGHQGCGPADEPCRKSHRSTLREPQADRNEPERAGRGFPVALRPPPGTGTDTDEADTVRGNDADVSP
jgi:hypothetical protein